VSQEVEDIAGHHGGRFLLDDGEEGLQVEGNGPQRVSPDPPGHELQVTVNERLAEEVAVLAVWRRAADKDREGAHPCTLAARCGRRWDALRITRVLSDLGYSELLARPLARCCGLT
jgi:hypothetical protein